MLQQNSTPPSGPKITRGSRGNNNTPRLSSRAGIHKRRSGPVRVDIDGDLDMEAAAGSGRGRGSRGRGTVQRHNAGAVTGRGGVRSGTRGGIGSDATQKAILRSMGSGAATVRGSRNGLNFSKIIREATDQGRGRERREGLHQISVTGWRRSKAASNPDGGIKDLLAFLERKAALPDAPAREEVKIVKVCLTSRFAGHQRPRNFDLSGPLSFQANLPERRRGTPMFAATAFG